ncbi:type II secretion protein F [Georgenia sp. AZ-5]|uniref:type II secretion protein F n=1 Tax=Georgenia sp. AZ-5 TaxID=3367526 RepID=UPI00375468F0
MTAALAGLLAAAAAALLLWRPRRRPGSPADPRPADRGRAGRRRPAATADLGVLVTEVATRLHAGADVETAWAETLERAGLSAPAGSRPTGPPAPSGATSRPPAAPDDGVPAALRDLASRPPPRRRPWRRRERDPARAAALAGTLAACRLTHESGAPLAQVLERCAEGITEAGHARAARAIALAGPRSTARLLGWLPLLGLALGVAVGADPLPVLLDGGLGTGCLLAGLALSVAGRRWVAALDRAAAGAPP